MILTQKQRQIIFPFNNFEKVMLTYANQSSKLGVIKYLKENFVIKANTQLVILSRYLDVRYFLSKGTETVRLLII